MAAYAGEKPVLLMKKLGGLLLVLLGCFATAWGLSEGATVFTVLGILMLAAGAALLAFKIARRNQGLDLR